MFYGGSTDYKIKNPIQYIFETGDEGYDEVQNALHEIQKHPELRAGITCKASLVRIKLPRFNSKRAGLWAYECYKHTATQYVANGKVTIRGSMKSAISELRCSLQHLFSGGGCGAAL